MALIKWGALVVDGRGKLGGHVLTKSRHGATMRTKVTPTNPRSALQQANRATLGALSSQWAELSESARKEWNAAVNDWEKTNIFGDLKAPSGQNLFISLNKNLISVGAPQITVPPQKEGVFEPVISDFLVTDDRIVSVKLEGPIPSNMAIKTYFTRPFSPGRYNMDGSYVDVGATDPEEAGQQYVARFGDPSVGRAVGVQVAIINTNTGEMSAKVTERTIVVEGE